LLAIERGWNARSICPATAGKIFIHSPRDPVRNRSALEKDSVRLSGTPESGNSR
jgi:hypothetical protein